MSSAKVRDVWRYCTRGRRSKVKREILEWRVTRQMQTEIRKRTKTTHLQYSPFLNRRMSSQNKPDHQRATRAERGCLRGDAYLRVGRRAGARRSDVFYLRKGRRPVGDIGEGKQRRPKPCERGEKQNEEGLERYGQACGGVMWSVFAFRANSRATARAHLTTPFQFSPH